MGILRELKPLTDALRNYAKYGLNTSSYPENVERSQQFEKEKAEREHAAFERRRREWDELHPSHKDPYWKNPCRD